jgi:hypothetical protein
LVLLRARVLALSTVIVALVAMVGVAVQRELPPRVAPSPAASVKTGPEQKALSAEEEVYAATLWPIHSEVVEVAAVDMSLAGIAYVTEHHDANRLEARVLPLRDRFRTAADKAQAIAVPASMQRVQDWYIEALALYETASAEMVMVAADGKVEHLIEAQMMSQRAAEDLLKVGDVLWPGEYKPN